MALDSLLEIIKKAQSKHPGFSSRLAEAEALGRWEAAVGELIAKHAQAIRVQDSVLWVEVEHPIWRAELHYRKKQILDILNGVTPVPGRTPKPSIGLAKKQAKRETLKDIFFVEPRGRRKF